MPSRYPDHARFVARACERLGYVFTDLDDGGGYLFAVGDGTREWIGGAGWTCAYPLNAATAHGIARDKHHTATVLARAGLPTVPGALFFIEPRYAAFRAPGREMADARAWLADRGFPVFCKPNTGARGDFAEIVDSLEAFEAYAVRAAARYDAILIQPVVEADEHRVLVVDGRARFSVRRAGVALVGDGRSTVGALLEAENLRLAGEGVSPLVPADLGLADVPEAGRRVPIPGRRNIALGGEAVDLLTEVPVPLAEIAVRAAAAVGLRVAGVDIFETADGLAVLEVNGNPSIASLSALGRDDLIDDIWCDVLRTWFAEQGR